MKNAHRFMAEFSRDALVAVLVAAIAFGPAAALPALAGPEGFDPTVGGATIDQVAPERWEITAPDGSVIQYSSFDIASTEAVHFIQTVGGIESADARVSNRILSALPTQIHGSLTGNGHIYIVNPAGVYVHNGATVQANGIHAAGGHLSDADFARRADGSVQEHYTGVTGDVTNATEIIARAVSLVGEQVVNSGQITAEDGWIVIAAGNDVIIGRETAEDGGRGLLLRIEGAAGATFDPNAVGVSNTGTLDAGADGTVRVGAGDLYGTAIFSNSAIRAREIALAAGNRGDIALGQEVSAEQVDIAFRGTTSVGELRSATEGEAVTVRADDVRLSATGSGTSVQVSDDVAFRSQADATVGPQAIAIEQNLALASSRLAQLDIGSAGAGVTREISLTSTAANVVVDDKAVVADSELALEGTLADITGTDELRVASLAVTGNARSAGDLVATAGDIAVSGNLELVTKPSTDGAPVETLVSAHQGALDVDGNVSTSAGGGLRIEALNVALGNTTDADPNDAIPPVTTGGAINTRGDLRIGFTDALGVQQTQTVVTRAIDTRGASGNEGGDVDIAARGNVTLGQITTGGGAGGASQPNRDGGSVNVLSTGAGTKVTVGAITTGGADAAEQAGIELEADTVVLAGSLSTTGGSIANADHARDRAVMITADTIELDADTLAINAGDIDLGGALRGADVVPQPDPPTDPPTRRSVDLTLRASGDTTVGSTADLKSLAIESTGESVVLGGNIDAEASVRVAFSGPGTGAIANAGAPITVSANRVELSATDPSASNSGSAQVTLGDGIDFDLFAIPATETVAASAATLVLDQDASIDSAATTRVANAAQGTTDLTLELRSQDAVSLDADARAAVAGRDLVIDAQSFSAIGATQTASDFALSSLDLRTRDALDIDFGVTADNVKLTGAFGGVGDLTLRSALRADTIALVAGNGPTLSGSDSRVVFGSGASLRSQADADALPTRVDLIQDAALDSAALPENLDIFGSNSVAGMISGLQSTDASVTLSAGSAAKFAGSALELRGQTGVNLGDEELSLASLRAETPAGLVVNQRIDATDPDGKIRLRAGSDGSGDLSIDARLAANTIELVAGSGNGTNNTSRILLDPGARFSAAGSDARPDNFTFEQDASIGAVGSTALPDLDLFGGDIAGMNYTLRSNGSSLRIDNTANVNGTTLTLEGDTGVDVNGDLVVAGLDVLGATALSGDITSSGDVTLRSALTLDGTETVDGTEIVRNQSVSAGAGNLTALGAITKTGAGTVSLSGQVVEVAAVTTGRTGDSLTITGVERVKTGALDASGAQTSAGGNVTVSATPGAGSDPIQVEIASISARGGNGLSSSTAPEDGRAGGTVSVTGRTIAIGNANSSGGNASSIAVGTDPISRTGGNAGAITLDADTVTMRGSLDASGGAGASNVSSPDLTLRGAAGDVSVLGSILLDSNAAVTGSNVIRGDDVVVDGGVSRAEGREPGQTELAVFADSSLSFGGNLTADRIDLALRTGDLDLAAGGVNEINANIIRLTASDGNGGDTDSRVVLTGLTLENEAGDAAPGELAIEQDFSIGGAGSPLPGIGGVERSVALISQDGAVEINGSDVVAGTTLTLAANGVADSADPFAVRVIGALDVEGLVIGSSSLTGTVDGDAQIGGDLRVGSVGLTSLATEVDIVGEAVIAGNSSFSGADDQTLSVGAGETLTLGGANTAKTSAGKLTLDADSIALTGTGTQTIENRFGQLEIGSANGTGLVKGSFDASGNPVPGSAPAGLVLSGSAADGAGPAITVRGTRELDGNPAVDGRDYAIAVADGDLVVDARALPSGTTPATAPATWSVEGDVLGHGDVTLLGRGVLTGGRPDYVISSERAAQTSVSRGGELRISGLASADGDVALRGEGDEPTTAIPTPRALGLSGEFDLAHDLTLSGVTEIVGDTVLRAGGDLTFESDVRGPGALAVESGRVLFTSTDETQTISAGSLSCGSNDAPPPSAQPSAFRDGDLQLSATSGNVQFAPGQQLIVAGDLGVNATDTILLADAAALNIDLNAPVIQGRGGSSVVANHISVSSRPSSVGGVANFATPTREQFSGDVAGAGVLLRQISGSPVELTYAGLLAGDFPEVTGPAYFDFATQIPHIGRNAAITRPRAEVARLAELRDDRPLWADELLFYLDARSRRAPSAREQGALPPVSAGPNATTPDSAREAADPAVEKAVGPYRALFRPDTEIDPESGIVQGEDRAPQIRAAFEQAAAGAGGSFTPTAAEVAAALERNPNLRDARTYRADLAQLIAAANRVLEEDQQVRFRERLLARVAPSNMSPAEFSALIP